LRPLCIAREVELYPNEEEEEIIEFFEPYGLDRESMEPMMVRFRQNSEKFVDFMMRFELNLELPDSTRSWVSLLWEYQTPNIYGYLFLTYLIIIN
jgi:MoaA/NifB/PqqE/SkfB family radical SAM enzyme